MKQSQSTENFIQISALQGEAWEAWNASYHEENRHAYQALGAALYRQAVHERITVQLARLDEQNAFLDRLTNSQLS